MRRNFVAHANNISHFSCSSWICIVSTCSTVVFCGGRIFSVTNTLSVLAGRSDVCRLERVQSRLTQYERGRLFIVKAWKRQLSFGAYTRKIALTGWHEHYYRAPPLAFLLLKPGTQLRTRRRPLTSQLLLWHIQKCPSMVLQYVSTAFSFLSPSLYIGRKLLPSRRWAIIRRRSVDGTTVDNTGSFLRFDRLSTILSHIHLDKNELLKSSGHCEYFIGVDSLVIIAP